MNNSYSDKQKKSGLILLWENLILISTKLLILLAVMLPTGSIYNIKIKYILTILVAIFVIMHVILSKIIYRAVYTMAVSLGAIFLFICFGWLVASFNGIMLSSSLSQGVVILSTFALIFLPSYLVALKIISPSDLLNTIQKIAFAYALVKICLAILILLHIVSGNELFELINIVFGYKGMTNDYTNQSIAFLRINFPSDYILPVALFIALSSFIRGKQAIFKGWFASIIYITALILTYSRFLWFFGLVSILIVYLVHFRSFFSSTIKKVNYILPVFGVSVLIMLLILQPKFGKSMNDYIIQRYTGNFAQFSDASRTIMNYEIKQMALKKPILGWGLGAYVPDYVRFPESPWLYELQWLSFYMQFGLLGVGIVLSLCLWYIKSIFRSRSNIIIGSGILFFVFLSVGFFNCFLLYSSIGVLYLLFYLMPQINWSIL